MWVYDFDSALSHPYASPGTVETRRAGRVQPRGSTSIEDLGMRIGRNVDQPLPAFLPALNSSAVIVFMVRSSISTAPPDSGTVFS